MAQIFSARFTLLLRLGAASLVALVALAIVVYRVNARSDAPAGVAVEQAVPFSHKHHVGDDGIDCRYCHTSAETARSAGIPPLSTCMTCHSQIYTDASVLQPIVRAYRDGAALRWNRVHDLPDFVYFDHGIHVSKGVGCSTCHGAVDTMPLTWRVASLDMQWCLDCHRAPEQHLRPIDKVFDMQWRAPPDQLALGLALKQAYHVRGEAHLTMCSTCHR